MQKIRVGIAGYGNLGRGVELALRQCSDMELAGIFTRRPPESVQPADSQSKVFPIKDAESMKDQIDVMILCGGSASDLPQQGPYFAGLFNTIDSFDTHAKIPEYFDLMNQSAKGSGRVSIISVGWDPGLFSINRLLSEAILPNGQSYTFWGKGVSQGHSDAIRGIKGVKDAKQYTIPIDEAVERVRDGLNPQLSTAEKHLRDCYVVAEEGADKAQIEQEIKTMPNYFADYETRVTFISEQELKRNHSAMPHGGFVIRSGKTGEEDSNAHIVEFSLKLDSNPEFTASVLAAYARAAWRMSQEGQSGAKTVFDVPPAYLSPRSGAELRKELL
ncbi:MAG: diaminopimelate dehydrogenase [Caldicoprobacterales bacterium]|jgi:diaminopimelate dehydrogenase|nr:diaminopimelate dehydrogenase [Clostridiales bacterium]